MSEINFCNTKEQLNHLGEVVTGKTNGSPSGSDISSSTLPYTGQVRKTLPALEAEYTSAIQAAGGDALNNGVWAAGQTFTAYNQYMVYNGVPYKPKTTTSLPYGPTGVTPDFNFVQPYVEISAEDVSNTNLIINSSFEMAGSVANAPDATPRNYSAGDELFQGFKAVGSMTGVTYSGGVLGGTGQLYVDVDKSEKMQQSTSGVVASVSGSNGKPTTAGVTAVDNGSYYRVTFDVAGVFSVKLEQGLTVTRHETPSANTQDYEITSIKNKSTSLITSQIGLANNFRVGGISTTGRHISIIGDSISQGAYSRDIYKNNWTNILKRNANNDRDSNAFGFGTTWPYAGSGATYSKDFYDVDAVPSGNNWQLKTGADATDSPNGLFRYREGSIGDTLRFTIPMINRRVKIYFQKGANYGSFDVKRNGVTVDTQNSDISTGGYTTGFNDTAVIELQGKNGTGICEIDIVKLDTKYVAIAGIHFETEVGNFTVDNFSHSGRRLQYASELVIDQIMSRSEIFICALGHNDQASCDADPALLAQFQQRLDWIKTYSEVYKTQVVFLDFIWSIDFDSSPTRQAIKNSSDNISKSIYLPFPENFSPSRGVDNTYPSVDPSWNLFDDSSHPNVAGHRVIGESVSKALGFSSNSHNTDIDRLDWFPITLPSGLLNNDASQVTISAAKENSDHCMVKYRVKASAGGVIPSGTYQLYDAGEFSQPISQPAAYLSDDITADESKRVPAVISVNASGVVNLRVQNNSDQTVISGLFSFAKIR